MYLRAQTTECIGTGWKRPSDFGHFLGQMFGQGETFRNKISFGKLIAQNKSSSYTGSQEASSCQNIRENLKIACGKSQ